MAVKDEMRQRFATLSPALQQIAKYVLEHPNEVVTSSMRTVGTRADAPPSTLVRFAQHFGYEGWPQFKQAMTEEMGLGSEAYSARALSLVERADDETLADEIFKVHHANLEATRRHSTDGLAEVAELLGKASAVHAAGFRACFPIAFSFVYVYRLFRTSVHLIDGQGGSLEMQQRAMNKDDAVMVISFAPYSREAMQVAEAAKATGCKLVALTDSEASPVSLLADATLLFSTHSPSFFPSVTSAMAVTEALVELLASQAGKTAVKQIDAAETQLFSSGAYLEVPQKRVLDA